jgi:hypothetical protein
VTAARNVARLSISSLHLIALSAWQRVVQAPGSPTNLFHDEQGDINTRWKIEWKVRTRTVYRCDFVMSPLLNLEPDIETYDLSFFINAINKRAGEKMHICGWFWIVETVVSRFESRCSGTTVCLPATNLVHHRSSSLKKLTPLILMLNFTLTP